MFVMSSYNSVGKLIGNHVGGYDGFTFDISQITSLNNELIIWVHDPSDYGFQPEGKQRISAIKNPGGDTYTPSSGIWQTVWLENVPSIYISSVTILADTRSVTIFTNVIGNSGILQEFRHFTLATPIHVEYKVMIGNVVQTSGIALSNVSLNLIIPSPKLWEPRREKGALPFLYNLTISITSDEVQSYFGMRSIELV